MKNTHIPMKRIFRDAKKQQADPFCGLSTQVQKNYTYLLNRGRKKPKKSLEHHSTDQFINSIA